MLGCFATRSPDVFCLIDRFFFVLNLSTIAMPLARAVLV